MIGLDALTKMPKALLALAVLLALLAAAGCGAWLGHSYATARGNAALATLKADHADELADRWSLVAAAEREARERYQARAETADRLASDLAQAKRRHAAESRNLKQEIDAYARAAAGHVFDPGFVRLLNQALRASGPGGRAVPGEPGAAGTAPAAGTADPLDPRLLEGVTEADLLANADANGQRCADIASQLNALIDLIEAWKEAR